MSMRLEKRALSMSATFSVNVLSISSSLASKVPSPPFLLSIWITPMIAPPPRMPRTGWHRMLRVRKPVLTSMFLRHTAAPTTNKINSIRKKIQSTILNVLIKAIVLIGIRDIDVLACLHAVAADTHAERNAVPARLARA